jgi:hypothetical protein
MQDGLVDRRVHQTNVAVYNGSIPVLACVLPPTSPCVPSGRRRLRYGAAAAAAAAASPMLMPYLNLSIEHVAKSSVSLTLARLHDQTSSSRPSGPPAAGPIQAFYTVGDVSLKGAPTWRPRGAQPRRPRSSVPRIGRPDDDARLLYSSRSLPAPFRFARWRRSRPTPPSPSN